MKSLLFLSVFLLTGCFNVSYYSLPLDHDPNNLVNIYGWQIGEKGFFKTHSHVGVLYVDGVVVDPDTPVLQITPGMHTITTSFTRGDLFANADFSHDFVGNRAVLVKGEVVENVKKLFGVSPSKVSMWIEDKASGEVLTNKIIKPLEQVPSTNNYDPFPIYLEKK